MKILVTGAAGFIGSHLAEGLLRQGHQVVGIDNFSDYYSPALKQINAEDVTEAGAVIHRLDLAEDDLSHFVEGVEVLYHAAAQPGIADHVPFDSYLRNNFVATHRLLETVRQSPSLKLFVNISTSSVYGLHATDNEETPPKPTSYYGVTKLAAEQLVMAYQRDKDLPATSLRLFSVYGERERPEKLYTKLIRCILEDRPFPLHAGSEHHSRSFTYVGDIIRGFLSVLEHIDVCNGEIFNIGSDIEITTADGIRIVEDIMGKKATFDQRPPRAGDQLKTHANIEKARRLLNYDPQVAPREGLQAQVNWLRDRVVGRV